MMISMKNRDKNVSIFMFMLSLRESSTAWLGIRKQSPLLGESAVKEKVLEMARKCFGLYNRVSANIILFAKDFEFQELWTRSWQEIEDAVVGLGAKCSIILYKIWHPESSPGIAVDIHVLTLAKALGIFDYDSSDQEFFQNILESIADQKKWPEVNLLFGGLFQCLHLSRGQEGYRIIEEPPRQWELKPAQC
jgi:endonuclease III